MKNRYCGENTRLIADVIEFCKIKNFSCIILLVDFEKAFDTVNWSFFKKQLQNTALVVLLKMDLSTL